MLLNRLVQCDDGDVNLLHGELMGQVQLCVNKRWATVCDDGWNSHSASTVCRQLGYDSGKLLACVYSR